MKIKFKLVVLLIITVVLFSVSVEAKGLNLVIDGTKAGADLVVAEGNTLVPAWIIPEYLDKELKWDRTNRELKIDGSNLQAVLPIGRKIAFVGHKEISLDAKTKIVNNQIMIPLTFLHKVFGGRLEWNGNTNTIYYSTDQSASGIVTSSVTSSWQKADKRKKIVIDPGHGGGEPGAVGISGVKEKNVNYQIAQRVFKLLEKDNFKVKLTRWGDRYVSLAQRAQLANNWSTDLFVSIHANSNERAWSNGLSTYAHQSASQKSWGLAWYIQDEILKRTGINNNGLKADNFAVLRRTYMPSVLIETAFLSNPREEYLLTNNWFQQKTAEGIVAGIKRYFAK